MRHTIISICYYYVVGQAETEFKLQCVCIFEQLNFLNLVWHSILFFVADGKETIHFSVIPPVLYCAMLCENSFQA